MKAKCSKCGAVYNVDDSKIPENGAYATCAKCKTRFRIEKQVPVKTEAPARTKEPEDNDKAKIIICPNCDHINVSQESCAICGMIFSKEEQEELTITV